MGPPKSSGSRKGKKAWRRNISSAKLEKTLEAVTKEEAEGTVMATVEDEQLFFVDKAAGADAQKPKSAKQRAREKLKNLTAATIVQAPNKRGAVAKKQTKKQKSAVVTRSERELQRKKKAEQASKNTLAVVRPKADDDAHDMAVWEGPAPKDPDDHLSTYIPEEVVYKRASGSKRANSLVKAVEVDKPGCSYNPDKEYHQDALAEAVAAEVQRDIKRELAPKPLPFTVSTDDAAKSELEMLQHLEEAGSSGDEGDDSDGEDDDRAGAGDRTVTVEKKTRAQRNKEARARAEREALETRARLKKMRRDVDMLKKLEGELEDDEEESAARQLRRRTVVQERMVSGPPKLGKHRFEDEKVQVLASEDVGGGLRRLKAFPLVTRDRFKSIQKRGIVETRKKIAKQEKRKQKEYVQGERFDKASEKQGEINEILRLNRAMAKEEKKKKKRNAEL